MRVVLYVRVSTREQAMQGYSIDAQLERLRTYCKAKDYENVGEYIENGYTGRNINRPEYQRMLSNKDNWDMILVLKMDRIHRNSRNFMAMMDRLNHWNKEFSSMYENLDTSTAIGRFVIDIIQRIAQLESEQIGERVKEGMRQKVISEGGILGFDAPYGYFFREGELVVNARQSKVVRYIYWLYQNDNSTTVIALKLDKSKFPTKRNGKWSPRTIGKILKNSVYCGYLHWDGIVYKGRHKAIIDIDDFNQVQKLICDNTRNTRLKREVVTISGKI